MFDQLGVPAAPHRSAVSRMNERTFVHSSLPRKHSSHYNVVLVVLGPLTGVLAAEYMYMYMY